MPYKIGFHHVSTCPIHGAGGNTVVPLSNMVTVAKIITFANGVTYKKNPNIYR